MRSVFFILSAVNAYSLHDLNQNENTWEISGCHNQLIRAENEVKYIVSTSFPNVYSQRMDCTWKIQAPLGKIVELTFPTFHIDFCSSASLSIFDGPKTASALTVEHCGLDNPPAFRSNGQMVSVQAKQNQAPQGNGMLIMMGFQAVSIVQPKPIQQNTRPSYAQNPNIFQNAGNGAQFMNSMSPQMNPAYGASFMNALFNGQVAPGYQNPNLPIQSPPHSRMNSINPGPRGGSLTLPGFKKQKSKPEQAIKSRPKPQKKPIKAPAKKTVVKLATSESMDNIKKIKQDREDKKIKDQETLKQQLIIVTIILVLIISGNIWFIWYKRNIEQENMAKLAEKNGQDINSLNNADKNSFTSRAPVLDNQESIYCSLDDI